MTVAPLFKLGCDRIHHRRSADHRRPEWVATLLQMGRSKNEVRGRRAGLRRARSEGKQLGRPKIDADIERAILADLRKKDRPGVRAIAAAHGVALNTVQRIAHAQ